MSKKSLTCILVLFAVLMMMIPLEPVDAVCCGADGGICADGTEGTPYCGRGPCNILGCNCDNGCREKWDTWQTGEFGTKWLFNCDFPGNDIGNQELGGEQCGNVCNLKEGCNHFSYHFGKCWYKSAPISSLVKKNAQGGVCGVLPWKDPK